MKKHNWINRIAILAVLLTGMIVSAIMPSFALLEMMPSFLNEEVEPAEAVEMEADDIPGEGQNGSGLSPERAGDRTLSASGFTKDIYSLETNHNGYFGMLRYQNGTYNCNGVQVYLEFSQKHDGTFGAVINADGLEKLKSIYGVTQYGVNNSNCVYTGNL